MNQCRGLNRGFLVFGMSRYPHRNWKSIGNPVSGPETTGAQVALLSIVRWLTSPPARPTIQPAKEDQGTDHRKMRIIGASDIRVPSSPSTNHLEMPHWGLCSKAWTSRPIWLGSRLNSLLRGLWRPRSEVSLSPEDHLHPRTSHKDQVEVVLARCCHPRFSHFAIISSARLVSFPPAQLLFSTLHSLSSLVGDDVFSRLETPSRVACERISAAQGPLPLVSAPITNAQRPPIARISQPSKIRTRFLEQTLHFSPFSLATRTRDDLTTTKQ